MNKIVSVIIPTYNCDRYVVEAVKSAIAQTYEYKEIIVVDDGSTDQTKQLLETYNGIINYIYQENQGVSAARNRGIKEAKGELICFLDADDFFILPSKLSEQVACFEAQPSIGIVHTGWQVVDSNGKKLLDRPLWNQCPNLNLETWLTINPVLPSAMMFSRDCLERVGGFDTQFSHGEDTDMMLNLGLLGCKVKWLKKITVAYRQHSHNSIVQIDRCIKSSIAVLDKFFNQVDIPDQIREIKNTSYYHQFTWLAWCSYENGDYNKMVECLEKALLISPYKKNSTIILWLKNCKQMSLILRKKKFRVSSFVTLPEWKQLVPEWKQLVSKIFHNLYRQ
jgi:glycosyltransferase involved in cell wall biosynthesis